MTLTAIIFSLIAIVVVILVDIHEENKRNRNL